MQNNMKLYATITDSRGKKDGKGDNEYLEIMLIEKNDNRFLISYNGDKIQILNYCTGEKTIIEYQAKKQKDDLCPSGHKQDADGRCKCTNSDSN